MVQMGNRTIYLGRIFQIGEHTHWILEADVVEACEAGTIDILDGVVRYQEVLLPPHKHKVRLLEFLVIEAVRVEVLGVLVEC